MNCKADMPHLIHSKSTSACLLKSTLNGLKSNSQATLKFMRRFINDFSDLKISTDLVYMNFTSLNERYVFELEIIEIFLYFEYSA